MESIIISFISIFILLSGCMDENQSEEKNVIAIINLDLTIFIELNEPANNNSALLIPTIVDSDLNLISIDRMEVNHFEHQPIIEISERGYVINITELIENITKFEIKIFYDYYDYDNKYSINDIYENNNTKFFMNTPGISTWSDQKIWIYSMDLNGTISCEFYRGGDDVIIDTTHRDTIIQEGWHGYNSRREHENIIG